MFSSIKTWKEWNALSAEEKSVLRSRRAKLGLYFNFYFFNFSAIISCYINLLGVTCPGCGCIGYFKENCPNCAAPSSPEKYKENATNKNDSLGLLWGLESTQTTLDHKDITSTSTSLPLSRDYKHHFSIETDKYLLASKNVSEMTLHKVISLQLWYRLISLHR